MTQLSESDINYFLGLRRKALIVAIQAGNKAEVERIQKDIEKYENMLGQRSVQKQMADLYAEFGHDQK